MRIAYARGASCDVGDLCCLRLRSRRAAQEGLHFLHPSNLVFYMDDTPPTSWSWLLNLNFYHFLGKKKINLTTLTFSWQLAILFF